MFETTREPKSVILHPAMMEGALSGLMSQIRQPIIPQSAGIGESVIQKNAPYQVGDILYVQTSLNWKSSDDIPPDAASIFFKVVDVHIERLWDIEKYPFTHPDIDPAEIYHAKGYMNEGLVGFKVLKRQTNKKCNLNWVIRG